MWLRLFTTSSRRCSSMALPKPPLKPKPSLEVWNEEGAFVDFCEVQCTGGRGGDGCVSFLRAYCKEFGGPDGGDGGNGGHLVFQADEATRSLNHLKRRYRARFGKHGRPDKCDGADALHTVIPLPLHTTLQDAAGGEVLCELKRHKQIFLAARGGAGGRGNRFFVNSVDHVPQRAELGAEPESRDYHLEMRVIAHAGLIGYPNAGKSSLLRAVSRAAPRVASYPFTTLNPSIGMVEYEDLVQLAMADIPGIIEGAHLNAGLGVSFLRHIERCLCLIYVVDGTLGDALEQLEQLRAEVRAYDAALDERPRAIVVNKCDLAVARRSLDRVTAALPDERVFAFSAKRHEGVVPLLLHFRQLYERHRADWGVC